MGGDTSPTSLQEKVAFYRAKIKEWEGEYLATKGTRPDKEALSFAPDDIKTAYKSYYRSRKQLEKAGSTQFKENSFEKENIEVDNNIIDSKASASNVNCELENESVTKIIQDSTNLGKLDNSFDKEESSNFSNINSNNMDEESENKIENEGVWSFKFNKNNEPQNKKSFSFNSDSLYSKMAEKMRDVGTVKVRTSLKKRSSVGSTQRLNLLKKSSKSPALSRSFSSPVGSGSDFSFSDISESINEPNEMFADESGPVNECVLQENKNKLDIKGQSMNSVFNNDDKDKAFLSQESQRKSIFEAIEKESELKLHQNSEDSKNYIFDTDKCSIPFKVNKRNPFTIKSQVQVVSAVSACSKGNDLNLLFTKNKNIDRAWLARTTNDLVGEKLESGNIIPAKDWKMKLVEKEWNESENLEDMDTEDGIKLNIELNEQENAVSSSKKATNKKEKQILKNEPDQFENKQTNKNESKNYQKEEQILENGPEVHENQQANKNELEFYEEEIFNETNISEPDGMEESISMYEPTVIINENIKPRVPIGEKINNDENTKIIVPTGEKRSSKRNNIRKNLKESDSEEEGEQYNKEIDETGCSKRRGIVLHEPLPDDDSEDEWKPPKNDKNEIVNDDEIEEKIEEGIHEWEENATASRGKKRRAQTLEELEDDGVIQSSWPAPKKRRTTLNPKKGRKALMSKAEQVAHNIETDSPKVNKTRGRKRKTTNPESTQKEIKRKISAKRKIAEVSSNKLPQKNIEIKSIKTTKRTGNISQVGSNNIPNETGLQPSTLKSTAAAGGYNEQEDIDTHGTKTSLSNTKMITKEERFAKKVASGTVNQNYLKINLKKKTFVRGKKTMTGGKYRRAEWKKKQVQKGAEQGNEVAIKKLTCFKCGDFGHWSKFCPGKSDKLMGIDQYDENESTFLSLEEASNLALGIKPSATTTSTMTFNASNNHAWFGGPKESDESNQGQHPSEPPSQTPAQPSSDEIAKSNSLDVGSVKNNENKELLNSMDDDLFDDENMEIENDPNIIDEEDISEDLLQKMEDDAYASCETSTRSPSVPSFNATSTQSYYEPRPTVEPLYPLLENGEVQPTTDEVKDTLNMFGYSGFREGQEDAIMRVLSGQSTLLILSTGSGKSLCYQLPAYIYAKHYNCITLCVSPLVSLMEDQVTGLPHFLNAVCLHHYQSSTVRSKALTALQSGNAHILLVSPEAVVASRSGGVLGTLLKELPPIAFACLDEAHCVSEWSHNFRPSYLRVCQVMREKLGVKTILGLTATARHSTAISIARHLQVSDQVAGGVIRGTGVRENLLLSISRDKEREKALLELLQGERFVNCSSIIIYCTRRDLCEKIATFIRSQLLQPSKIDIKSNLKRTRGVSFDAEAYHAGLSGSRRGTIQKRFMSGKLRIVVATVAFGMGIDKADLRGVIHFNMPKNVESYVQEIGRAGRDGQIAHCHLFLDFQDGNDQQELKRHIFANSIDRHTVRKLLNKMFKPCACAKLRNLETSQKSNPSTPTKQNPKICQESETNTNNMNNATNEEKDSISEDLDKIPSSECNASAPGLGKSSIAPSSCPRHEVAIEIEKMVEELDLPEENLQTLLCYLELQPGALVQLKHHVYSTATVACYGGARQLVAISRRCPPLAVALALQRQEGKHNDNTNTAVFNVIEVSAKMGWNSGVVKRELKNLEWNNGKRSGVNVEFSDLAFNMFVRGDLNEDEQDQLLDDLFERAMIQERDQLRQLQYTYQTLRAVSHNSILLCCDEVDMERCIKLRNELIDYFSEGGGKLSSVVLEEKLYIRPELEMGLRGSVRAITTTHSDMPWTGRAVARVFHGIGSPNFPAATWGRVRRFWRSHLNIDFKIVVNLATQEILKLRK